MTSSHASLDLRTICDVLGSIEHKWFKIGVQLGIPRGKLLEFKKEEDPFSAVADYCLRGNVRESGSPLSWEAIVVALKSTYVGEPGLAEKIDKDFCQRESNPFPAKDLPRHEHPPSPPNPPESTMHPDVKLDLEFILERNLKQISYKYASYVDYLRAGVCEKQVSPEDLHVYLLSLHASSTNYKGQKLALLSDKKKELESCKTIATIFAFLTTECASFLNFEVFESIRKHYKVTDEEEILATYPDSLKNFIKKHKISEFTKINPLLKHKKGCKELVLKYDIEIMCNLAKVDDLKKALAEIMDLSPSALEIVDVKDGCVIVTFLIPASVADALFTPDTAFTPQQRDQLRANSVLWIKCNGNTYNFEKQNTKDQALQKLREQLTCCICLGTYTDPKQLQCQHAFCQQCLMGLVQQDQQGQPTLTCPTCRQITPVPASGVASLQADFRTNQLLEVMNEDLPDVATHSLLRNMEEEPSNVKPPDKKHPVFCSEHDGKEVELFCGTCNEPICWKCAMKSGAHYNHDCSDLFDVFGRYEAEILTSLAQLDARCEDISKQRITIEQKIHGTIKLDSRKAELISQLHQLTQAKLKTLTVQRDRIETIQVQLDKHLYFVRESDNQDKLIPTTDLVKQAKDLSTALKLEQLNPNTDADILFLDALTYTSNGTVCGLISAGPPPFKCHVQSKTVIGEEACASLEMFDANNQPCIVPADSIGIFLTHEATSTITKCSMEQVGLNIHKIGYQPTITGTHQLHLTVEGQHIRGSPFPIAVESLTCTEFASLKGPHGIAINQQGEVIVASWDEHSITVFSASGEKLLLFGEHGSGPCQFKNPSGLTVDHQGSIVVADYGNHRVQKFTSEGNFLLAVGNYGSGPLQFNNPHGIAFNTSNNKFYVTDKRNNRIQVLNSDLSFSSSFGERGKGEGQFYDPGYIACDSSGNVYVNDSDQNHRIQIFTAEGKFLRMFGRYGDGRGEFKRPYGVAVDSRNRVYVSEFDNRRISVFSCDGQFMYSFVCKEPRGLAVNRHDVLFMCAYRNSCVVMFSAQ